MSKLVAMALVSALAGCGAIASKAGLSVNGSTGSAKAPDAPAEVAAVSGAAVPGGEPATPAASHQPYDPVAAREALNAKARAEDAKGLPPKLIELIDRRNEGDSNLEHRASTRRKLKASAATFAPAWDAYQARKQVVDAAVAKSQTLGQAGDWAGARAALDAVITPVVRSESGAVKRTGGILEPIDAELAAVQALLEVAGKQKDYVRLAEAGADLYVRRSVGTSREDELSIWLAIDQSDIVDHLSSVVREDAEIEYRVTLMKAAWTAMYGRELVASRHLDALGKLGLARVGLESSDNKPGSSVLLDFGYGKMEVAKIDGRSLVWSKVDAWQEPYDCKETNRIHSVGDNGQIIYRQQCKFKSKKREVSLNATFAEDLPAWAEAERGGIDFFLIGVVERVGPAFKLKDVRFPDLRYRKHVGSHPEPMRW